MPPANFAPEVLFGFVRREEAFEDRSRLSIFNAPSLFFLYLCINKDTLRFPIKILTILLIQVLAIRKETIRFLAYRDSFPI